MKFIEKLYKATLDVKRAVELPLIMRQTSRILDEKVRSYDALKDDAELDMTRLYSEFVEADKDGKGLVFERIVEKRIEIEEAERIAIVAKAAKDALFAEVKE